MDHRKWLTLSIFENSNLMMENQRNREARQSKDRLSNKFAILISSIAILVRNPKKLTTKCWKGITSKYSGKILSKTEITS